MCAAASSEPDFDSWLEVVLIESLSCAPFCAKVGRVVEKKRGVEYWVRAARASERVGWRRNMAVIAGAIG